MSTSQTTTDAPTKHGRLRAWVEEVAELTQPDAIHWCDGSAEEYDALCRGLVEAGAFERAFTDFDRCPPPPPCGPPYSQRPCISPAAATYPPCPQPL